MYITTLVMGIGKDFVRKWSVFFRYQKIENEFMVPINSSGSERFEGFLRFWSGHYSDFFEAVLEGARAVLERVRTKTWVFFRYHKIDFWPFLTTFWAFDHFSPTF